MAYSVVVRRYVQSVSFIGLFLCLSPLASATVSRKDVVIMKNGDRLTGDIKKMENGVLYIETNYFSGSVGVDWKQVEKIRSTATYQITLTTGDRLKGKIEKLPLTEAKEKDFVVDGSRGEQRLASTQVAAIDSEKPTFWRQLSGSVDSGYSFTSGNSQSSVTSDASTTYTTEKWLTSTAFDTSFNGQAGASKTNRIDGQLATELFLSRNSFLVGLTDLLHSSQQDLDLRATVGGGYGRYWIRTASASLAWLAGAVYTNEHFKTGSTQPSDNNAEGLLGLKYDSYRFNFGELHSQLLLFPGVSDTGRIRTTTNNSVTINLTNNFHFTFTFWDNFDSKPPATAKKNELGVSSGVGWSF
jgi:putative salt-induced outer membrane protein YdiY